MADKPHTINIAKIGKPEIGFISFVEGLAETLPFEIKRVYWTYFTPNEVQRGGHAHKALKQLIIAVAGTITFKTEDVNGHVETFVLDKPNIGLYIPKKIWRDIQFSHNAVLLCLASEIYTEDDYIREYAEFKKQTND